MLKMENVSLRVENGGTQFDILKNINITLKDKKFYVVTGPNGSGKSSLAKIIMGLYKPTSGTLFFNGVDITGMDITGRANLGIGYAFQHPPRFKGIKVRELLSMAAPDICEGNICELLFDVGLCAQDYLNRDVDATLSGGELKRIEIATILARKLKLAVFDEPEAGIDLWSFQKLAETFKSIHDKYETTILIISHQEKILNLADEVLLMSKGNIEEVTTREKILTSVIKNDNCRCSSKCEKGVGLSVERIG